MPQEQTFIARTSDDKAIQIIREIKSRQTFLELNRKMWDTLWEEISQHLYPLREDVDQTAITGEKQGREIYDGIGQYSHGVLTDGIYGHLINPAIRWMKFQMRQRSLNEVRNIRIWLDEVEEYLYGVLIDSTFYDDMHMFFQDYTGWGTGYINIDRDPRTRKLMFTTLHPGQMYINSDIYGMTDTVHRKVKLQARQAKQLFGLENLTAEQQQTYKENPFRELPDFIHAIYPRDEFDPRRRDVLNMPFASVWINPNVREGDPKGIVKHSGNSTMPIIVGRYRRSGREEYGRGPGMDALIDMMGANLLNKMMLGVAEKAVDPPMAIPAEMKGKENFGPRGPNYFTHPDMKPSAIETTGQYQIGLEREEQKREAVRRAFHVDFFLLLQGAQRQMTAEEVIQRQSEKATVLGPMVGGLTKTLDAIIDRVFELEMKAGNLPPLPPEMEDLGVEDVEIDIQYLGPLAQMQKKMFQIAGIRSALAEVGPLAEAVPGVIHNFNTDKIAREVWVASGAPERLLNTEEEVESMRASEQASAEAQEQLANLDTAASATQKLAQADASSGGQIDAAMAEMMGAGQ
jgi:hypothetical protein